MVVGSINKRCHILRRNAAIRRPVALVAADDSRQRRPAVVTLREPSLEAARSIDPY